MIAGLAERLGTWAGIDLARGGQYDKLVALVTARAADRGLAPAAYAESLIEPSDPEVRRVLEGLLVNHSWFFRDPVQLAILEHALADRPRDRPARIWVPGCANGEDVYTLAMMTRRMGCDAEIVGTDLSSAALARARAGRYDPWSVHDLPEADRAAMRPVGRQLEVDAGLRTRVRFEQHNLVSPPLLTPGGWDLVLCRNVLIYLLPSATAVAIQAMTRSLAPHGWLVLGCSEMMHAVGGELEIVAVGERFAFRRAVAKPTSVDATTEARRAPSEPRIDATLALARDHLFTGDAELAITLCTRVLLTAPHDETARLYLGVAHHMTRSWSTAAAILQDLAHASTGTIAWTAACYLALCHERLGRADDALREFQRVVEMRAADDTGDDEWRMQLAATAASRIR